MRILEKINIESDLIDEIKKNFTLKHIKSKSHLFYSGQIPIAGYFLLKGKVEIYKNKRNKKIIKEGSLFGIHECLERSPVNVNAEILPDSELYLLDQSTLKEILETTNKNVLRSKIEEMIDTKKDL